MKKKSVYFKKGDLIVYFIIGCIFLFLGNQILKSKSTTKPKIAEIYVNNELKYIYPLEIEKKEFFIPTDIGGVNIRIQDKKIRVITSNSPLKLDVKQGWIGESGQVIIGVPDRLIIKIVGEKKSQYEDIDYIIK